MADLEKVKKGLWFHAETCSNDCPYRAIDFCVNDLCRDALELLKEQEQKAKWIYGEDEAGVDGWHCSECNFFEPWFYDFTDDIDFIRFYKHCPNCGRKMTSYTGKPTRIDGEVNGQGEGYQRA